MRKINFLPKKPKSDYVLNIIATPTSKASIRKSRISDGFSKTKKVLTTTLVTTMMLLGVAGGAAASTNNAEPASAFLNPAEWVCATKDTPGAYLGGTTDSIKSSWNRNKKDSPVGNGINVTINPATLIIGENGQPTRDSKWTALEQYGYKAPSFETWTGILYENKYDGSYPFYGSGGHGKPKTYGDLVAINDATETTFFSKDAADCLNFGAGMSSGFGNFVFDSTKTFVAIAAETYGIASTMDLTNPASPLKPVADGVEKMITGGDQPETGLKNILFLDWLLAIIIVGTCWIIWIGLIQGSSLRAGQSAIWMIAASVSGFLFLTNPMFLPGIIDNVVGKFNVTITSAIIPSASQTKLCEVGGGGTDADKSVRQVKCSLWYTTIYSPWVKGQFGVDEHNLSRFGLSDSSSVTGLGWMYSDTYENLRTKEPSQVSAWSEGKKTSGDGFNQAWDSKTIGEVSNESSRKVFERANIKFGDTAYSGKMNWAVYMLDRQNNWTQNRGVDMSEVAFNQVIINKNSHWSGASDAVGSGMNSLFSAAGPGVVLLVSSGTLIGYQIALLFLIIFSPLLFLAGVAPGWGKGIAMRWFELMVNNLIQRVVLGIFIVFFVRIYMLIIQAPIDWWVQALIVLVFSVAAMMQRQKITRIFTSVVNFGGDKRIDDGGETGERLKNRAAATASRTGGKAVRVAGKASGAGLRAGVKSTRRVASAAKAAKQRRSEEKNIGSESKKRRQEAINKVNASNANTSRFTESERQQTERINPLTGKPIEGTRDPVRMQAFLDAKKAEVIKRDTKNKDKRKKAVEDKKQAIKDRKDGTITSAEAKQKIKAAAAKRAEARRDAKKLKADSERWFGDTRTRKGQLLANVTGRGKKPYYRKQKKQKPNPKKKTP